ncbi:hypothetical protein Fcan01_24225 [Folsomia candida]|uniref:Uncharacterized protein n=1 Tax=Folsomia candida TaxID=158441 RepID=A0A226D702_FOLCA|nr:hypothetical protein Fcan01_24225 [Folsomia candida]
MAGFLNEFCSIVFFRSTTWHHKKERRHSPQSPRVTTTQKQLTQKQIYDAKKSLIEQAVRKIQARLVEETRRSPVLPGDPTIIIGVDATPFNIGGYLINLAQKRGEFYSFPVAQLPWTLSPTSPENIAGNAAEFEILNLMFALYLWRSKLHNSKVLLYTDNFEFNKIQTPYGIRAQKLVRHLKTCEGIEVQIEVRGTNEKGIVDHAKFVKPADDFSRHRFNEGCDFVVDYFGIKPSQLTGSHALKNYVSRPIILILIIY